MNLSATYAQGPTDVGDGNKYFFEMYNYSSGDVYPYAMDSLDATNNRNSTEVARRGDAGSTQTGTIAATLTTLLWTVEGGLLSTFPTYRNIDIHMNGNTTGAADVKVIEVRLGGTAVATLTVAAGTQAWSARVHIFCRSNGTQKTITEAVNATVTALRTATSVSTVDDVTLEVWTTIAGAADTAVLNEYNVVFNG
jgi:hypothetical protein